MENFIYKLEIKLIESDHEALIEDDFQIPVVKDYLEFINTVICGQFEEAIQHPLSRQILNIQFNNKEDVETVEKQLQDNVISYLTCDSEDETSLRQFVVLAVAIINLQLFVQNNWVGPLSEFDLLSVICLDNVSSQETVNLSNDHLTDYISKYLSIDGEIVYPLSSGLLFLALARILLLDVGSCLVACKTHKLWLMRCLQTQQALFEEKSPSLKSIITQIISELSVTDLFKLETTCFEMASQFHLESGYLLNFYYEDAKAQEHFSLAKQLQHLSVELKGVLGKRTRFQERDISQLILQVERVGLLDNDRNPTTGEKTVLPRPVAMDDEAIMESIKLKEPGEVVVTTMTALDEAVILGLCDQHRKTHEGQGKIVQEESLAYINCILSQPRNWCVQTKALLVRAKWETETSRQLQRSLSQLEELVKQFNHSNVPGFKRLHLVYTVSLPPKWVVERRLAELLTNVGATASALEVYLRLQMWEDVIKCYVILGHKNEAEQLIKKQIAVKETPTLWCYLGDVTRDPEHYLKAWQLSNYHNSRSQRSLGYLYLRNREFEKSLPHFEKSLEINSLQIGVWFSYGCACLSCHQYDKAAKAFRRCVVLNSDNFEAWNNLATAYIRADKKPRAFVALQEALKCDFENWKIWENYLLVSVDVGEFEESIKSYHRLMELRQKHLDIQVLRILVKAIVDDIIDASNQSSSRLRHKALVLFGRITASITNNADIWQLYAQLLITGRKDDLSDIDIDRALQYLRKSYKFYMMDGHWDSDLDNCKDVCQQFVKITSAYEQCLDRVNDVTLKCQMVTSALLSLRSLIMRVEKNFLDPVTNELPKDLVEAVEILTKSVQKFLDIAK